ncbi:MAG: 50S ribosomal protein L28 [Bdellovibrio sp.]
MPRCELTGQRPVNRNRVSHSNVKTKAQAWPNVQSKRVLSRVLGQMIRLKIGTHAIKSMEHQGGFDAYLLNLKEEALSPKALEIKRRIQRKMRSKKDSNL